MYRLATLGRLSLEGDRPPAGAATRPRPLALLALLATAGEGGIGRDKVVRYLWPESNTSRGRNSLHQTLHSIRRDLGAAAVIGTPNLRLNPAVFSCDLWDFDAAAARGSDEEAIALYSGPFLEGFSLRGLPEFEQWLESERARIAERYAHALEDSAAEATRQGDHRRATQRWQALTRLDPLSSRSALGLMRAFIAAGNGASALEHARDYEAQVRRELGTAPDEAIRAFVEEMRAGPRTQEIRRVSAEQAVPADPGGDMGRRLDVGAQVRRWLPAMLLAVAGAGALAAWWSTRRAGGRQPVSPDVVAILPFTVVGSPAAEYLSSGLVDLLATNLDGAEGMRSVDPHALLGWLATRSAGPRTPEEATVVAARFGAGLFVLGNVIESGGQLHLRAAMYDSRRPGAPVLHAAVDGDAADLFGLVDQLTAQILAGGHEGPRGRLARVAATTTDSIEALKSYLRGERELRTGGYVAAADAFREAVARDTAFALAHYRLSIAAERLGQDSIARWSAEAADRFSDRLSEHDRLLVRALMARRKHETGDAEQLYRRVVDDYPDDVEAWWQLGEVLFHGNPLRGRSSTEARPALEQVLRLDPENEEVLIYLARIAFIEGRRAEVDTLVQRVLALAPSSEVLESRAFRAFALGDRDGWKRVTRELLQNPPDVPPVTALQVAVYLDDVEGAQRFAELLRDQRYSDNVRGLAYRLLARVAAAKGQWSVAQAQLDTARQFDATAALELRSLLAVLPFLHVPRAELLAIRREVEAWRARPEGPGETSHSTAHAGLHPYMRLYRLGLLSAQLGDTAAALQQAGALDDSSDSYEDERSVALGTFAHSIRARVATAGGRPAEALEHLDAANWELVESRFETEALDRYNRAELLYALGRPAEALGWYRSIAERATYEMVYVAPARWRQGEIHERAGDREKAGEAYADVMRLWRHADPRLQATVADAERRLHTIGGSSAAAGPARAAQGAHVPEVPGR